MVGIQSLRSGLVSGAKMLVSGRVKLRASKSQWNMENQLDLPSEAFRYLYFWCIYFPRYSRKLSGQITNCYYTLLCQSIKNMIKHRGEVAPGWCSIATPNSTPPVRRSRSHPPGSDRGWKTGFPYAFAILPMGWVVK